MSAFRNGFVMVWMIVALAVAGVASAEGAAKHPDGRADVLIGWGPTTVTPESYSCTLFTPAGNETGAITFGFTGDSHVQLNGRVAYFSTDPVGVVTFSPLDEVSFPSLANVPDEFKTPGNSLMIFAARFELGVNTELTDPLTPLARSITSAEARCVYIVDPSGLPVFCLNCVFLLFHG